MKLHLDDKHMLMCLFIVLFYTFSVIVTLYCTFQAFINSVTLKIEQIFIYTPFRSQRPGKPPPTVNVHNSQNTLYTNKHTNK